MDFDFALQNLFHSSIRNVAVDCLFDVACPLVDITIQKGVVLLFCIAKEHLAAEGLVNVIRGSFLLNHP